MKTHFDVRIVLLTNTNQFDRGSWRIKGNATRLFHIKKTNRNLAPLAASGCTRRNFPGDLSPTSQRHTTIELNNESMLKIAFSNPLKTLITDHEEVALLYERLEPEVIER
jgi:hypothetical protein